MQPLTVLQTSILWNWNFQWYFDISLKTRIISSFFSRIDCVYLYIFFLSVLLDSFLSRDLNWVSLSPFSQYRPVFSHNYKENSLTIILGPNEINVSENLFFGEIFCSINQLCHSQIGVLRHAVGTKCLFLTIWTRCCMVYEAIFIMT